MNVRTAFPPVAGSRPEKLILGSMPGETSLAERQYYAHPRNAFWPIMEALFGVKEPLSYPERLKLLMAKRIALWDVFAACQRRGSADADIQAATASANDFAGFFSANPGIQVIFFNGKTVERFFRRHVLTQQQIPARISCITLPSTSPANARLSFQEKLAGWRPVAAPIRQQGSGDEQNTFYSC